MIEITEELDRQAVNTVEREFRQTQKRNYGHAKVDVAEVYSPPHMTAMAFGLGCKPGFSMDLTTVDEDGLPWDMSLASTQRNALRRF